MCKRIKIKVTMKSMNDLVVVVLVAIVVVVVVGNSCRSKIVNYFSFSITVTSQN